MRVRNLSPWSGDDFSHHFGDVIELPDEIAEARVLAGLAEPAPSTEPDEPATGSANRRRR